MIHGSGASEELSESGPSSGKLGTIPSVNEFDDSGKKPLHPAALAHASRCVEVLLKNDAPRELRTKDGHEAQLGLELSLSEARICRYWNPKDFSMENYYMTEKDLSTEKLLSEKTKDLSTEKLLSEKTKEIADMDHSYTVKGRVASLPALLIAAAEKVNDSVLELRDSDSGGKEKDTLYECLIREALAPGGRTTTPLRAAKRASTATESENSERRKLVLQEIELLLQLFGAVPQSGGGDKKVARKLVLREIELLQLFGAVAQSGGGGGDKKVTSLLIRAAQGGDKAVIRQLLLKTNIDVNDADADGNSALHWILGLSCPQQLSIVLLLLEHAAGNGNSKALEILLLDDPLAVQYMSEQKETPLFFAVKNESEDSAELLITSGANSEVLNVREKKAIDLASQDMRFILLNVPTSASLINQAFPSQHKCTALEVTDEGTSTETNVNSSTEAKVHKYFDSDSHQGYVKGVKKGAYPSHSCAAKQLRRKIFVGGLPPSVDSDVLVAEFEKVAPQQREQEKNFQYQLPLQKSNEYIMGSWHGTTILWIQLPTELLVGVDSQSTRKYTANDPNNKRTAYEILESEIEDKLVEIIKGVYATLCGDGKRCKEMVKYVREQMKQFIDIGGIPTLKHVGEAATAYFHQFYPMDREKELESKVYICGWIPHLNKYDVIEVGDVPKNALLKEEKVFGSGSGSDNVLRELKVFKRPIDVSVVKNKLIRATLEDPYTGGRIQVYSLKDDTCVCKYEGYMINELHNPEYANILFDGKSMFVIIQTIHAVIVSPQDIMSILKRFNTSVHVHWLCFVKSFLVYRVILSSPECCDSWFGSCEVFKEPIRRQRHSTQHGSCDYYLGYAGSELLLRALKMKSFDDLADSNLPLDDHTAA